MRLSSVPARPISSGVDCFDSSRVVEIAKSKRWRKVSQQQVVLACDFDGAREVPTECIRREPPRRIPHLVAASRHRSNVPRSRPPKIEPQPCANRIHRNQEMQTEIVEENFFVKAEQLSKKLSRI
jgi:hypothetical protein